MHKCDNCKTEFDGTKSGVVTTSAGRPASAVCDGCTTGAKLIKVVLRRGDLGGFAYEQFTAIEMEKPKRAAG